MSGAGTGGPSLAVRTRRGWIAIPLTGVRRLEAIDSAVPVPAAPPGVVGVAEIAGRPLTLVDPAALVAEGAEPAGEAAGSPPRAALVCRDPFGHLALALTTPEDARTGSAPSLAASLDEAAFARALARLTATRGPLAGDER